MTTARAAAVGEEDFLALPESMDRVELIDGEVIVSPSPSPWHQELLARITFALRSWLAASAQPAFVGQSPLDVRFQSGRILQPDAFVILAPIPLDREGPIDRVPELCIEVLSTNRAYDRLTKRYLYAEAGVVEYWMVDPAGVIERRHGQGLHAVEEVAERLTTPLLPGFALDVQALFRA